MNHRLLIVEDHPLVAQGLKALLADHYEVAEIVLEPAQVLAAIRRTDPALVLLDLSMPGRNGFELLPQIKRARPSLKVLVVTMHIDRSVANLAFKVGADGFVPKEATARELREAIDAVLRGERFLSARVPKRGYRAASVAGHPGLERLTPRQLDILRLMGEGRNGPEISEQLDLSPKTIEFHRARMRHYLGLDSEAALLRFAVQLNLTAGQEGASRSQSG